MDWMEKGSIGAIASFLLRINSVRRGFVVFLCLWWRLRAFITRLVLVLGSPAWTHIVFTVPLVWSNGAAVPGISRYVGPRPGRPVDPVLKVAVGKAVFRFLVAAASACSLPEMPQ